MAQAFDKNGKLTEEKFWVTLLPGYMTEEGEQYAHLPFWMQKAVEQGIFDAVTKPATALKISAGDAIGFLGKKSTKELVNAQNYCALQHLQYFKIFLVKEKRMPQPMKNKDWLTIAQKYNGKRQEGYDVK
ncbi:N-acetylmuramidase domain-containing protein [Serratia rubidaea]|uniref:N-acetylmuramidase domain-containing protein n=1 Tax=Serratia rubidaea TaxID=61652 RepID=UPI003FA3DA60